MVSFIIPAYNEEFELPGTLESLRLAAGNHEHEIIVVDDASIDRTAQMAKDAGVRVVSINRRQIAAARNAGARAARGEVLFFVDADTRIRSEHVDSALIALRNGFSGGSARIDVDGWIPRSSRAFLWLFSAIYFACNLGAGAFLFTTRENYDAVGGLDEDYFAGEEVWFSIALKKFGPFKVLKEPIRTSGRKMRMYPPGQLWWQMTRLMLGGLRASRRRQGLDLWYDGRRENATDVRSLSSRRT
jgi:glycosyltransferase involved in cell wall biosynthesis